MPRRKRFELIEHTADIGLEAFGRTLAEAYANAAFGMFSIIAELDRVRETEKRPVAVEGVDPESLLFNWLNQLIYLFEVEHIIFKRFDITGLSDTRLEASVYGEKYDRFRHQLKIGVKSATYHQLAVDKTEKRVRVIFDV